MNAENDSTKHMTAYSTIIQGCRKDAPGAQAEFYDLHAQPLFLIALRLLNDEYEAEEAVQEVMLHVLTRKHLLIDTQADMARRMRRMVVNHCIDRLRKRRVRWEELDDKTPLPHAEEADLLLIREEQSSLLRLAIGSLPDRYRTVLMLSVVEEMDTDEISALLHITPSSVRCQLSRAKQQLIKWYRK